MTTSATMSDPQYTDHGAIFPIITITPSPSEGTRFDGAHISIHCPDGAHADAHLTQGEILTIRDYLDDILTA